MNWIDVILWILGVIAASPFLLWPIYYLLFHTWAEATQGRARRGFWYYFWGVIGYVLDIIVNVTWGTVLFAQRPSLQRLLLSPRMDDLIRNGSGWRRVRAIFIVGEFLEPYDLTGQHTTYGLYHA